MKKKFLAVLLSLACVLCLVFGLSACDLLADNPDDSDVTEDENLNDYGLEYKLSDDGKSYFVTGIGECTETEIVIPSKYNGKPVTYIGALAFDCASFTSVVIPDSVISIGMYAFHKCCLLTNVTIGNGLTSIGSSAFFDCCSLTSITIPDSVTSIGDCVFELCISLTSVTFENTNGWYVSNSSTGGGGTAIDVTNASQNATYLTRIYYFYGWYRSED